MAVFMTVHRQKQNDNQRQNLIEADGLTVLRFTNEEVVGRQETVIKQIEEFVLSKIKK